MNRPFSVFAALLFVATAVAARGEGPKNEATWPPTVSKEETRKYEDLILKLRAGTPHEAGDRAPDALLCDAGMRAFPTLLASLNGQIETDFVRELVSSRPDGSIAYGYHETIGDVCWGILEKQIEGADPWNRRTMAISFRTSMSLNVIPCRNGWTAHKGLSLPQLQLAARKDELRLVEWRLEKHPKDSRMLEAASFFRKKVKDLEAAAAERAESPTTRSIRTCQRVEGSDRMQWRDKSVTLAGNSAGNVLRS